ncbi:MAG: TolB family protein [Dehalococcoidia bacterium]
MLRRPGALIRRLGLPLLGVSAVALTLAVLVIVAWWPAGGASKAAPEEPTPAVPEGAPQGPPFFTLADLGVKLAYARIDAAGNGTLVIHTPDGNTLDVRAARGVFTGIAWSPDGQRLAMSFGPGPDAQDVYVVDGDGRNLRKLTADGASRRPTWSPDGSLLAFSSGPDGSQGHGPVMTLNASGAAGAAPTALAPDARYDNPAWAPDGSSIAVTREAGTLVLLSPTTGEELKRVDLLRESAPSYTSIDWSSDSTAVAGTVSRGPSLAIVILTDNLTAQRQVGGAFLGNPVDPASVHPSWVPGYSKIIAASAVTGDLVLVDVNALPEDLPSAEPYSPVQVLVAAPPRTRLAFPAVSGPRSGGRPQSVV